MIYWGSVFRCSLVSVGHIAAARSRLRTSIAEERYEIANKLPTEHKKKRALLCIRLLGRFDVRLNDSPASGFRSDKVRALLAYLVTESDRAHRRETLAGLLWPDVPEAAARNSLRTALVNLRSAIGDRAADPPYLHISRTALQFNADSDAWCDVTAFRRLVASSSTPLHEEEVVQSSDEAVELYRGSFLEGFSLADSVAFEDWVVVNREQFQRQVPCPASRPGCACHIPNDHMTISPHSSFRNSSTVLANAPACASANTQSGWCPPFGITHR